MSFSIPGEHLTQEIQVFLNNKCHITPKSSQYDTNPTPVPCFSVDLENNEARVPLGIWRELYDDFPNKDVVFVKVEFQSKKSPYTLETDPKHYRDQNVVLDLAYNQLILDGYTFLALPTGFGKTGLGMMLSSLLGLRVLIACHYDLVNEQWKTEYEVNSTATVSYGDFTKEADVYICGIKKLLNVPKDILNKLGIGTIIADEAHVATSTLFTKALLLFKPRYLIGLSATPKRIDGMHKLFNLYFGNNVIERSEVKDFTVYKVLTPFEPEVKMRFVMGKMTMDWTSVVSSICDIPERQALAVQLVEDHVNDYIMILSDRQSQSESIYNSLIEKGVHATLIIGTIKKWDTDARVLVCGMKKAGVGFNDPRLTMLIMMSDTKHVEQYEGRLRTVNCKIYDLVDNFKTLENHWKEREKWYRLRGATIIIINLREVEEASTSKANSKMISKRLGGK